MASASENTGTSAIPSITQSLWIGKKLSVMEKLSISSFLQNGHPYHLYVYDDVQGVPRGTALKDANAIIPSREIFKNPRQDTYAGFSDVFRFRLLLEKGGYWVDTDVVCLKPFRFESAYVFARVPVRQQAITRLVRQKHHTVVSWIIKAPPGSEIMDYCYNQAAGVDKDKLVWGEIGPDLITTAVHRFAMQEYIAPSGAFFPIHWWQWNQLVTNSLRTRFKWKTYKTRTSGIHLYHEMWRKNGIDKNATFHPDSIYELLKTKYLIGQYYRQVLPK